MIGHKNKTNELSKCHTIYICSKKEGKDQESIFETAWV